MMLQRMKAVVSMYPWVVFCVPQDGCHANPSAGSRAGVPEPRRLPVASPPPSSPPCSVPSPAPHSQRHAPVSLSSTSRCAGVMCLAESLVLLIYIFN